MLTRIKFGWVKDKTDTRDFDAQDLIRALTKKVALPLAYRVNPKPYIYNQGEYPACVGAGCSGAKTDQEWLQRKRIYKFNWLWLYNECKKVDGYPNEEGTETRYALKILAERGTKEQGAFKSVSHKWSIESYYRIKAGTAFDNIKTIIYLYGSIVLGSDWYANWMEKFGIFPKPKGLPEGGHLYKIGGWTPSGFIIDNSWGTELWGMGGSAVMSEGIFNDLMISGADCWKLIDYKGV